MTGSTACWKPTLVCLRACVLGNARAPMGVCVCAYGRVGGLCLPVPFCARLCKRMCSSVGARPCARSRVRAYSSGEKGLGRDSKKPLHFKNSTFHSTLPCPAFTVLFRQFPHVVRRDHPSIHVPGRRLHRRQRHRRRGAADASDCSLAHRSQEHVRVTWTWCTVRVLCGCASDCSGGLTAEHLRREIPRRELWAEAQRKGAAVDGERGAEHERFAVLYYNGRHAAPRRQARRVRPRRLGVHRRREDGEGGHVCRRAARTFRHRAERELHCVETLAARHCAARRGGAYVLRRQAEGDCQNYRLRRGGDAIARTSTEEPLWHAARCMSARGRFGLGQSVFSHSGA